MNKLENKEKILKDLENINPLYRFKLFKDLEKEYRGDKEIIEAFVKKLEGEDMPEFYLYIEQKDDEEIIEKIINKIETLDEVINPFKYDYLEMLKKTLPKEYLKKKYKKESL